jgi:hypothetical protein
VQRTLNVAGCFYGHFSNHFDQPGLLFAALHHTHDRHAEMALLLIRVVKYIGINNGAER